jgi:hypothetical protein
METTLWSPSVSVTGDLLQVAHKLHELRRRGVEDDNGPQSTVGERIGELSVERCIIESGIGLRRGTRSLRDRSVAVVGQITLQSLLKPSGSSRRKYAA